MLKNKNQDNISVTILGSMPPLRALSSYCLSFFQAISGLLSTDFISFKSIYPSFLYPGGEQADDNTFPPLEEALEKKVRRNLTWYNPLSWIMEGVQAKGQILHAQWWSPPLILIYLTICIIFKIRKRPVIFTVHNIISHEKNPFYEMCSRFIFKLGDHFIVHSKANRERLMECFGIKRERISQIPHGPLSFGGGEKLTCEEARKQLGIASHGPAVLFFGAIRPYKGLDIALNAFVRVIKEVPDARLIIAGRLCIHGTNIKRS
jgi:glycosyltransferase involved in cell wall biosynthesis